jgi:hypothetical protein
MTTKQLNDIEVCRYFIPDTLRDIVITDQDKENYIGYSERGEHKELIKLSHFTDGFNALVCGKKWRGIQLQIWEEGILETLEGVGGTGYVDIVSGMPGNVVDFIKREMFGGADAEIIEYAKTHAM